MTFTSLTFLAFLAIVLGAYWGLAERRAQNVLLLVASYVFYGWVHPWFCVLIATSTVVDYGCGLAMERGPRRRPWLVLSLVANLGMLAAFKYFGFFAENVGALLSLAGLDRSLPTLHVVLPVGISFYTFQTLSYTIDVYRGECRARRSFVDFALFVSFFPQLVAGPIERATRLLPQVEGPRRWSARRAEEALSLGVRGYLKKLVVADNVAVVVDRVFGMPEPTWTLLAVGSLAFAIQIYADFSAYTDLARASAKLLGFELMENFHAPYLAVSPSDFWRRWHVSFSSWIRDYLYIPLGGSRVRTPLAFFLVLLTSLGLSGLWHGAAWNFVLWGVYHAVLVFAYHQVGRGGRWAPATPPGRVLATALMFAFTLLGWLLFRAHDLAWLARALRDGGPGLSGDLALGALHSLSLTTLYALPLLLLAVGGRRLGPGTRLGALWNGAALVAVVVLAPDTRVDFIYFQF